MIISFSSLLILLYCIFLAALVWRAKSKGFENKFMSVLLVCEGIKASFIVSQTTYIGRYEWLQDILWHWTIDVFFTAHITAVIMYLCIPIYYRLNRLKFHAQAFVQEACMVHPWRLWDCNMATYQNCAGNSMYRMQHWVVCEEGEEPTTDRWFGENETLQDGN